MKKKWTYLAVAGMLLGTAPVFTGCVDNDEPAGIEQLRGAKAQLLQAKAAVEEANAQWILADAQYREAIARHENALAASAEYEAEKRRLEAELMEAKNEKEKVRLQKEIEELQQEMERNALYHETVMLQMQGNFETVKRQYELLMQKLEIAEAVGSEKEQLTISELKAEVQYRYALLYGGDYIWTDGKTYNIKTKNALYTKLQVAQEKVYNESLNQAHGIINDDGKVFIPRLKFRIAKAEAKLAAEEEALTKLEEFLAKDVETADWRAEIAKLEETIAGLEKDLSNKNIELVEAQNSSAYLDLKHKLYGVYADDASMGSTSANTGVEGTTCEEYPSNWEAAVEDGAWQTYQRKLQEKYTLHREKEFTLAEWAAETEISANTKDLLDVWANDESITIDWQNAMGYDEVKYKYWYMDLGVEHFSNWDPENGEYPTTSVGAVDIKVLYKAVKELNEVLQVATKKAIGDQTTKDEVEDLATEIAAHLTAMETEFQKNYDDTFATADKAIEDAEKALVEADGKLADAEAEFNDIKAAIYKLEQQISANGNVKNELVAAVKEHLGIKWPDGMNDNYDPAKFEDKLQRAITKQEKAVVEAEETLANLEIKLQQAEDGQFDDLTLAQTDLEIATRNFNLGWEAYQEALNNLELGLAAIADEEEGGNAEQPGDDNQDPAGEEEQPAE